MMQYMAGVQLRQCEQCCVARVAGDAVLHSLVT